MSIDSQIAGFTQKARVFADKAKSFAGAASKSKTMAAAVILPTLVTLIPPAAPWIAANPDTAAWIVGAIMAGFRLITHTSLTRQEPAPVLNFASKQPPK